MGPGLTQEQGRNRASHRTRCLRILKRVFAVALVVGSLGIVVSIAVVVLTVRHYEAQLPSIAQLRAGYRPSEVTRILARDGTVLASVFIERRTVIPLSTLPARVKLAFLAAEDANFYEHEGLNYLGMLRALYVNLRAGRMVQGGSTITQQVVKNVLLVPERTLSRKIQETILARRLEHSLSKDDIFGMYLNHIYLGHGRYGVQEASRFYFGKGAAELELDEAALLAGLVASPERYSPRRDPGRARERRRFVLRQMAEKKFISADQAQPPMNSPLRLAPVAEQEADIAPEIVDLAQRLLEERLGPQEARRGGYTVFTSIDPKLQIAARQAVKDGIGEYARRHHLAAPYKAKTNRLWREPFAGTPSRHHVYVGRVVAVHDDQNTLDVRVGTVVGRVHLSREVEQNPQHLSPSRFTEPEALLRVRVQGDPNGPWPELALDLLPQAALVAIDTRSREVLALVGGREGIAGGLDRATQARRQPGSAFKPFVYSYALHTKRFTLASVLSLPPVAKDQPPVPRLLSVREALSKSDNPAAQYLLDQVGAANVVDWARTLGIASPLGATPSLALGAYEVNCLELTNAFATFASGGMYAPPVTITRILGSQQQPLQLLTADPPRRVLPENEAYLVTRLLRSVVEQGTAQRARQLGRPVGGKTGTTNQAKDAWFVGYSPELVVGVWVGYDDALPLGYAEGGAATALPIWVAFMKVAHAGRPSTEFSRPISVVTERVDPRSGLLAALDQTDAVIEEFLPGTAPVDPAPPPPPADAGVPSAPLDTVAMPVLSAAPAAVPLATSAPMPSSPTTSVLVPPAASAPTPSLPTTSVLVPPAASAPTPSLPAAVPALPHAANR